MDGIAAAGNFIREKTCTFSNLVILAAAVGDHTTEPS